MSGVQISLSLYLKISKMIINVLSYVFSSILLLSSIMVISVQNSVYSVLFLVLSFASAASLLVLFECEFIALMFIIVYVGAIAVLFLFVVMMLDIKIAISSKDSFKYFPVGFLIGVIFLLEIFMILKESFVINNYTSEFFFNYYSNWFDKVDNFTEIESIGQIMYNKYVFQFLIAGNILLLAAIAVVVLTLTNEVESKNQIIFKQISRTYKNSILVS